VIRQSPPPPLHHQPVALVGQHGSGVGQGGSAKARPLLLLELMLLLLLLLLEQLHQLWRGAAPVHAALAAAAEPAAAAVAAALVDQGPIADAAAHALEGRGGSMGSCWCCGCVYVWLRGSAGVAWGMDARCERRHRGVHICKQVTQKTATQQSAPVGVHTRPVPGVAAAAPTARIYNRPRLRKNAPCCCC